MSDTSDPGEPVSMLNMPHCADIFSTVASTEVEPQAPPTPFDPLQANGTTQTWADSSPFVHPDVALFGVRTYAIAIVLPVDSRM